MDKSTVTKMLMRLEKDGFIIKERHGNDARAFNVQLTERAVALIPQAQAIQSDWLKQVTKNFNKRDEAAFYTLIEKAADCANRMI